jgi:hypothetical protein
VLDLFEGQITIDDILNNEIAFVRELYEARQELIEEKEKAKARALEQAQQSSNSYYDDNYYKDPYYG